MRLTDGDAQILAMPVDTLLMNQWNGNEFMAATDVRRFLNDDNAKLSLLASDDEDDIIDRKPSLDLEDLLLARTTTSPTNNHINTTSANNTTNAHHNNHNGTTNNVVVTGATVHSINNSLAELKPLPPFTGYTSHLSINGISGHHYHTIACAPNSARNLIETNNNSVDTTNQNNVPYYSTDHVVSSSTMDSAIDSIKSECHVLVDLHSEDLVDIFGPATADTTSTGNTNEDSTDSWLDIDAFITSNYGQSTSPTSSARSNVSSNNSHTTTSSNGSVLCTDTLPDYVTTNSQFSVAPTPSHLIAYHAQAKAPTAQHTQSQQHHSQQYQHHQQQQQQREINSTFSHMPLLQSRLQNGPPKVEPQDLGYGIVSECPSPSSSTPYLAHSPPCTVVSTSDMAFIQVHSSTRQSPESQVSFPHTTTPGKKSRSRTKSKMNSNIVYNDTNLGKEKTVHRCNICNRGFLNKSNIKVHLRTHTGEKPFRCDVCGKAFRQKAHLIKHAQIHKRVGRD